MKEQLDSIKIDDALRNIESGIMLILYGLFVKLVIADRIGLMVNEVLDNFQIYFGFELICAIVFYGLQIYCDFSACTNIARGISRCFGFKIMKNFEQPYFSTNISEFWRQWHISLSVWLRDYIYIPLGGNRKGKICQSINLVITFLVSGLWHGCSLNYLAWGALHGLYQIVGKNTSRFRKRIWKILEINTETCGHKVFQAIFTFIIVDFAWILFRFKKISDIPFLFRNIVHGIDFSFFNSGFLLIGIDVLDWFVIFIGLILISMVDFFRLKEKQNTEMLFLEQSILVKYCIYILLFVSITVLGIYGMGYDSTTFIYRGF